MAFWNTTEAGGTFAARIRKACEHHAIPEPQSPPRRPRPTRLPRKPVFAAATLLTATGKLPTVVTNVTALGARVDFAAHVRLRGDVVLAAPTLGLSCPVRVAWQHDGCAGLIFAKRER